MWILRLLYENAVANWHGGYDLEGDYTGEGEYDQNGNYVGSRPTEEKVLLQMAAGLADIWKMEAIPVMGSWIKMEIM